MSWEELRKEPEVKQQDLSDDDKDIQRLIIDVFYGTQAGSYLLEKLLSKYLSAPVCPPSQNAAYGYYREGQNSVLLELN